MFKIEKIMLNEFEMGDQYNVFKAYVFNRNNQHLNLIILYKI